MQEQLSTYGPPSTERQSWSTFKNCGHQYISALTGDYSAITMNCATNLIWPDDFRVVSSDQRDWQTTCTANKWRCTENTITSGSQLVIQPSRGL